MSGETAAKRFTADALAVGAARRFLRDTLRAWGVDRSADAELVVSELVTNAIRHGGGRPQVRLLHHDAHVRIEVDDDSAAPPVSRWPGHQEPSGRGLAIIGQLALAWGHHPVRAGGKTVWADVPLA